MEPNRSDIFLVPTDFSDVCTNAARRAASVAKTVNYKITLLHVVDKNTRVELKKEGKGPVGCAKFLFCTRGINNYDVSTTDNRRVKFSC